AERVGARPRHLAKSKTVLPLESPTGAFIAAQTRIFLEFFFTGRGSKLANAAARHNFSVKTKIGNDRSRFRFF
ncbi:MAG TPA: hypothetical protein PK097_07005, partial [Faecalibacterium prausnitzii]|nr:hypothetical protein [Faecalibacterium prausnitzii]